MTFQPPPPPPPAPPPPGGGYGPPPASGGGGSFDPKSVNNLDWGIIAAGALAFIFSFVSYYSYKVDFGGIASATGHWNAWHGFFGWFAMLAAVVGSALVAISLFAPQVNLPVPARLACLGAYALATLCVILALFVVPSPGGYDGPGLDKGHGFGYWASLVIILAGLVLSLMRAQQTGTKLPGPLDKMPKIGS